MSEQWNGREGDSIDCQKLGDIAGCLGGPLKQADRSCGSADDTTCFCRCGDLIANVLGCQST